MDNMNTINSFEENLRNSITEYIVNNLDEFIRNDERNRETSNRVNSLIQTNNNSDIEMIRNILESLNRNMLLYHVNVTEYLGSINTILDSISNRNNHESRNRETNFRSNQTNQERNNNQRNESVNTNTANRNNNIRPRSTYYYHNSPLRNIRRRYNDTNHNENRNIQTNNNNVNNEERNDIWRTWSTRTPISTNNINSQFREIGIHNRERPNLNESIQEPRIQISNSNRQQRTPFHFYRYLSHGNDPFINNELMQEYFQNLFQNVIVSPTTEQINNATEVFEYSSNLDLINHSCPITLEEFQENDTIRRIRQCGHCFNEEPIQNWFRNNVRCPVCRLDIRDVSGNLVENENNNNTEELDDDENENIVHENIPSPRTLRPTLSDISVSTSSTLNETQLDGFLSNFANNIRDNLTENLENVMIPMHDDLSSHIQIDVPIESFRYQQWRDLSGAIFPFDYP